MMKKIFSLIFAIICLLSVSVMAGAAEMTDVQKSELSALGIMTGDADGDLRLNDTITRAEAVKMICTAGNIGTELIETNVFPDVQEDHWAYRYIAAAKENGIVDGDENGNFNPESNITNEELIKMAVCLVGYGQKAYYTGGYPAGYAAVAAEIGLTKDMQFEVGASAVRSDAGIILYNALSVPVMVEKEGGYVNNVQIKELVIMDGSAGTELVTLKTKTKKFDASAYNISKLLKEFASGYLYKEGDTEQSFELYPDIIYTSGIEYTEKGMEYECPAVYDDLIVPELVNNIKTGNAELFIGGSDKIYNVEYAVFKEKMLVPLEVFSLTGCDVSFDETSYVAAVSKNSTILEIIPNVIGMRKNQAGGFWVPLEVCARFVNNALYVPLEAVAREFDISTEWNDTEDTITIK